MRATSERSVLSGKGEQAGSLVAPAKGLALVFLAFLLSGGAAFANDPCDTARMLFTRGSVAGDAREAQEYFLKAVNMCSGFIRPYELLGNMYRKGGDRERALDYFNKAALLGTSNHKLYHLLAKLHYDKGDYNNAVKNIEKALALSPGYRKSLKLKEKISGKIDNEGPRLLLFEPAGVRGLVVTRIVTVRGEVVDVSGVRSLTVNGEEVPVEAGRFLKDLVLPQSAKEIRLEAVDSLGNATRLSIPVGDLTAESDEGAAQGELYALVIGVDSYENWPPLEFAVADANAVASRLGSIGFDKVTVVADADASKRRILTEIYERLPDRIGPDDSLLVFFAGHGQTLDLEKGGKRGFVIPVDAGFQNYPATAISMEQLRGLTDMIPARHILFLMDSCYSGLALSRSGGVATGLEGYLEKVSAMRSVQIITAGGQNEQAKEAEGHGLFTKVLLDGLGGLADLNGDGFVTGTELGAYVRPTVSKASGHSQTPLFGRIAGEGEFVLRVRD